MTMITAIGALIGFGGGPLMSIRMGRRDMDGARQIITNSFYLLLALSVLATVPLLIFKRQILFTFGCSRAPVGLRAGVLYDLCFRHCVRITELRTQSNYNESGIFGVPQCGRLCSERP